MLLLINLVMTQTLPEKVCPVFLEAAIHSASLALADDTFLSSIAPIEMQTFQMLPSSPDDARHLDLDTSNPLSVNLCSVLQHFFGLTVGNSVFHYGMD